jgi:hypothetical protein
VTAMGARLTRTVIGCPNPRRDATDWQRSVSRGKRTYSEQFENARVGHVIVQRKSMSSVAKRPNVHYHVTAQPTTPPHPMAARAQAARQTGREPHRSSVDAAVAGSGDRGQPQVQATGQPIGTLSTRGKAVEHRRFSNGYVGEGLTGKHEVDRSLMLKVLANEKKMKVSEAKDWLRIHDLRLHHSGQNEFQLVPGLLHDNVKATGAAFILRNSP